ncbi:hypothetical protein WG947_10805 [Pontibacter sp. H259]|uniref:hypothetical protein n=1 Tax=Pontibacter sp. H259 TaxID=3133421 RepID=UPI0030C5CB62
MYKLLLLYFAAVALLLIPNTSAAQAAPPDTSFIQQSVTNAVQSYSEAMGLQAHIYNGPEYYQPAKPYLTGHQFFGSKNYEPSAVYYDGAWFNNVPLLYDVMIDEVITTHKASGYSQMLVKAKLDTFKLHGHTFIHIQNSSAATKTIAPGYYDLLHNGSIQVLSQRKKELQERATQTGMEGEYNEVDKFYVVKDGVYTQVASKVALLKVLRDKKKPLNKYARANKLKFRKQRESAIVSIAKHYETL